MTHSTSEETRTRPWKERLLRGLGFSGTKSPRPKPHVAAMESTEAMRSSAELREAPGGPSIDKLVKTFVAQGRYVFILLAESSGDIPERLTPQAWAELEAKMAIVPGGPAAIFMPDASVSHMAMRSFYIDRHSVTNDQYQLFLNANMYENLDLWPRDVWASLPRFTDRTGRPGPRDWENGRFPAGKGDHPVTGVSWYEAYAYAHWSGKRLPTAAEWQSASGRPHGSGDGACRRYPWGDHYGEGKANLWSAGRGGTVSVHEFREGSTANGIRQLAGNVWEWLDDTLETIPCSAGESFQTWKPMRRIVGGAFDTYFHSEAVSMFVTGQPELDRRHNIGFRCSVSADKLRNPPQV